MRNCGQHNALMCGLRHARAKYVVTMDDDLQHPPEEIPKLLAALEASGNDVVYGVPDARKHGRWRNLGSVLVTAFYRLVFKTKVQPSPFRIMRREVVEAILSYNLNYTFIDGLLAWNTQRIGQITVEHHPRATGRSGYSLSKLLVLAMNLFTNFSLLPLQLVSLAGLLASLGGFAAGAYYLAKYLFAQIAVPGYASTIVAILVLGGLQLLSLGIIGEYLGRMHLNVNRKPQYTVRTVLPASRDGRPNPESSLQRASAESPQSDPQDVKPRAADELSNCAHGADLANGKTPRTKRTS
jgi:undecaprenyl-phosphate 4-deoxy-4-formamido-L-arabinose transferase